MAGLQACMWGRRRKSRCCFLFSLALVNILLPSTLSDEPKMPCDANNDGKYFRDNGDCAVAYLCSVTDGWLKLTCREGEWFDLNINLCNLNFMVQCSKECVDNPCILNGICNEIPKGYRCSYPNAILNYPNGKDTLLVSQHKTSEIFLFDQSEKSFTRLPMSDDGEPNVMKYEPISGKLYIAFETPDNLVVTDLKKSFSTILRSNVVCEGMDIDADRNSLFYTDYVQGTLNVMSLTGTGHKVLISRGLRYPRSVVADTTNKMLYWNDITNEKIEVSDYEGNNRNIFYSATYPPRALSIMPDDGKIFWCDEMDQIWEISVAGEARLLYKPPAEILQCDSLAAYDGHIYTVYLMTDQIYERDMTGALVNVFNGSQHLKYGAFKTVLPFKD